MIRCSLCTGPCNPTCSLHGRDHRVGMDDAGSERYDYFCVAESPYIPGTDQSYITHTPWQKNIEKTIDTLIHSVKSTHTDYYGLLGRNTYALRCYVDKPRKKNLQYCKLTLHKELLDYAAHSPIMVLALGPAVLQALDIKATNYQELQGKMIETTINERKIVIYPSLSKRQLVTNPGHLEIFRQHLISFFSAVYKSKIDKPIEVSRPTLHLTKNYHYPKTLGEVRELVDFVVNYVPEGSTNPEMHALSLDTETNTVYPHRGKVKLLTVVTSWAPGEATSIPVEHPESTWTLEEIRPHLQKLCGCEKPKIFHNAKFDMRILNRKGIPTKNLAWDTMLAEHLLREDKKGYYSLKELTRRYLPPYGNYEDELRQISAQRKPVINLRDAEGNKYKKTARKLIEDIGYAHVPLETLAPYGAIDADVTRQIALLQRKLFVDEQFQLIEKRKVYKWSTGQYNLIQRLTPQDNPLRQLLHDHVLPLSETLGRMEDRGIRVDQGYIKTLIMDLDLASAQAKGQLQTMVPLAAFGGIFNPASTQDLQKVFYSTGYVNQETGKSVCYKGVIESPPLTPTGHYAVNAQFLRFLVQQYDCKFAKQLLTLRGIEKARNTFIENVKEWSQEDGRMHASFHQHGTVTGRLSSSDENMQNIPPKIGGYNLKKIFIPTNPEEQVIFEADAKAAEVRIYAAYSHDANLIKALNEGMDPHSFFASMVFNPVALVEGKPAPEQQRLLSEVGIDMDHAWSYEDFQAREEISKTDPVYGKKLESHRKNIKRVVFGILYGASRFKISSIVGIPDAQAQEIINTLFKMFPSIPVYIQHTKDQLRMMDSVETFFGRRRRFSMRGLTRSMVSRAERQAVNFKIQSTSSDIVLKVLRDLENPITQDFKGNLLITVHDSIVGEIPKSLISELPKVIKHYGEEQTRKAFPWLPVPFEWEVKVGPSYGKMSLVEDYLANKIKNDAATLETYLEEEIEGELREADTV